MYISLRFWFFFVCKAIVVCVRHLFSFGHAAHSKVIILIEHGSREIQPSQVGAWNMGSLSMMAFFSAARRLSRSLTCNFVFFSLPFFKRYGEPLAKMATSLFFNWKNRWKRSAFQMEIAKNLATLRLSARNEKLKRDALTRPWNMQMTLCIDFFFLPPSHTHRFGLHTHTHEMTFRFALFCRSFLTSDDRFFAFAE